MLEVRHVFSYLEFNNHSVIHFGKRQYGVWYPYLVFEYVIKTHKFNSTRFTIEDSPRRIEMKEEIMKLHELGWGYTKIHSHLVKNGYPIGKSRTTIETIVRKMEYRKNQLIYKSGFQDFRVEVFEC